MKNYKKESENHYNLKKNGMSKYTQRVMENHIKPIEVIILGAVHIAQYLSDFTKNFNCNVTIIDPRKYLISNQRFENTTIITDHVFSKNTGPLIFRTKRYKPTTINLDEIPHIELFNLTHKH